MTSMLVFVRRRLYSGNPSKLEFLVLVLVLASRCWRDPQSGLLTPLTLIAHAIVYTTLMDTGLLSGLGPTDQLTSSKAMNRNVLIMIGRCHCSAVADLPFCLAFKAYSCRYK